MCALQYGAIRQVASSAQNGASGSAILSISLEKNQNVKFPCLHVGSSTYCIGMAATLEKAYQIALDEAYDLLVNDWKLDPFDAYAYVSACVDMRLGGPMVAATNVPLQAVGGLSIEQAIQCAALGAPLSIEANSFAATSNMEKILREIVRRVKATASTLA